MDAAGMKERRETEAHVDEKGSCGCTVFASVRMSMRHAPSVKAVMLVVVRLSCADDGEDAEQAMEVFGSCSMYREAVTALLKRKKNVLEMNFF